MFQSICDVLKSGDGQLLKHFFFYIIVNSAIDEKVKITMVLQNGSNIEHRGRRGHGITEILLKGVLNTTTPKPNIEHLLFAPSTCPSQLHSSQKINNTLL